MNKTKKILMSSGLTVASLGIIGFGAFAFFSSNVKQSSNATAGLVEISATNLSLTNPNNINPGDNAQDLGVGHRTGTSHDLTFNLANQGNKSVVTRNIVDLYVPFGSNGNVSETNSANVDITKYFVLDSTNTELTDKYYLVKTNASAKTIVVDNIDAYTSNQVVGIRYVVTGDSLNGVGTSAEIETANNGKSNTSYAYKLGMNKNTVEDDVKPLSTINIDVKVEAMQYRNTNSNDWNTVFSQTLQFQSNN